MIPRPSEVASGFEIVPEVFDPAEIARVVALRAGTAQRSRAGARHLMHHSAISRLARDSRLLAIAGRYLGEVAIPFRATLFDKSPRNNWLVVWHQDTALPLRKRREVAGWGPWSVKEGVPYAHAPSSALERVLALRVHIDDSRADNGPLRVIPGTHTLGLLSDQEVERLSRASSPIDCLVPAGGVVAIRPLLLHASSKAEAAHPRRVLHIEYADSLGMGNGLELAIA